MQCSYRQRQAVLSEFYVKNTHAYTLNAVPFMGGY